MNAFLPAAAVLFVVFGICQTGFAQQRIGNANPYTGESSVRYYDTPTNLKSRYEELLIAAGKLEREAAFNSWFTTDLRQKLPGRLAAYDVRLARYINANRKDGDKEWLQKEYAELKEEERRINNLRNAVVKYEADIPEKLRLARQYKAAAENLSELSESMPQPREDYSVTNKQPSNNRAIPLTGTAWRGEDGGNTLDFYRATEYVWRKSISQVGSRSTEVSERSGSWSQSGNTATLNGEDGEIDTVTIDGNKMILNETKELRRVQTFGTSEYRYYNDHE